MSKPLRGEIWLATLDPTIGREQAGTRPALIVSDDFFNQSYAELVVAAHHLEKQGHSFARSGCAARRRFECAELH